MNCLHFSRNFSILSILSFAFYVGCGHKPEFYPDALPGAARAKSSAEITWDEIPVHRRVVLDVFNYRASSRINSDRWWAGRLELTGKPGALTNFPVTKVIVDYVDIPGKSRDIRGPRLYDEKEGLIFYMDNDHASDWLTLLQSGKRIRFVLTRTDRNVYETSLSAD